MNDIPEKQIQNGWDFVMNKLYHPETHMIYDYLTKETAVESAEDYPNSEEIRLSAPNPCGWGTGMEDSTLNLSSMTEAILARYAITKNDELKPQLQKKQEYFPSWRKSPANYFGIFHEKSYYVPNVWADRPTFKWLRNVGESVIIQCTCPDYKMPEWEKEMFFTFIKEADFACATNYWPVLFCDAWWLAKEKGLLF